MNDPLGLRRNDSGGLNSQASKVSEAKRASVRRLLETSFGDGGISKQTFDEVNSLLNVQTTTMATMDQLMKDIQGEVSGTTAKGKSRLATEQLFKLSRDLPGNRQTLLTPRSNASKQILGV